jgi:hypothetical protein
MQRQTSTCSGHSCACHCSGHCSYLAPLRYIEQQHQQIGQPRATGYVCTRRRISTSQLDLWTSMYILQFFHIGGRSIHKLETRPGKFTSNLLHLRWRQQAHSFPSRVILSQSVKDDSPDVQIDPHANRITRHQHLQTSTFTCSATCTTRHKHTRTDGRPGNYSEPANFLAPLIQRVFGTTSLT